MNRPCSGQRRLGTSFSRCSTGGVTVVVHYHRRRIAGGGRDNERPRHRRPMDFAVEVVRAGAPHEASASMITAAVTPAMRSCHGRGTNGKEA